MHEKDKTMTNKQQITDTEEVWGNIELPGFGDDKLMSANLNFILAGMALAKDPVWLAKRKLAGERRAEVFKDPNYNYNYKGAVIGIHMETGEIIMLCGEKEMKAAGFNQGAISLCIHGKRNHHKKYIWSRDEPT